MHRVLCNAKGNFGAFRTSAPHPKCCAFRPPRKGEVRVCFWRTLDQFQKGSLGATPDLRATSGWRQNLPYLIQPPTCGGYLKADIRTGFLHRLTS